MNEVSARRRIPGTWYRLSFVCSKDLEDVLSGLLVFHGVEGMQTAPAGPRRVEVQAWFVAHSDAAEALRALSELDGVRATTPEAEPIVDTGWLEATLRQRGAMFAGKFAVYDIDEPRPVAAPGVFEILLPPGRAFGTGEHPTTAMCLELLSETIRTGARVLDLGTGSGILAIAASKAGAGDVLALDNDPETVPVARENLQLNGVLEKIDLRAGSMREIGRRRQFDLILANIHRTALVRGAASLFSRLAPDGYAVLSGFTLADEALVHAAWLAEGGALAQRRERNEWCALSWRR